MGVHSAGEVWSTIALLIIEKSSHNYYSVAGMKAFYDRFTTEKIFFCPV